jgi:hypothetical protein
MTAISPIVELNNWASGTVREWDDTGSGTSVVGRAIFDPTAIEVVEMGGSCLDLSFYGGGAPATHDTGVLTLSTGALGFLMYTVTNPNSATRPAMMFGGHDGGLNGWQVGWSASADKKIHVYDHAGTLLLSSSQTIDAASPGWYWIAIKWNRGGTQAAITLEITPWSTLVTESQGGIFSVFWGNIRYITTDSTGGGSAGSSGGGAGRAYLGNCYLLGPDTNSPPLFPHFSVHRPNGNSLNNNMWIEVPSRAYTGSPVVGTAVSDGTVTTVNYTDDGSDAIASGDIIKIDSEYMRVTNVNTTTNNLTVVRGHGPSTAAGHSPGASITNADSPLQYGSLDEATANDTTDYVWKKGTSVNTQHYTATDTPATVTGENVLGFTVRLSHQGANSAGSVAASWRISGGTTSTGAFISHSNANWFCRAYVSGRYSTGTTYLVEADIDGMEPGHQGSSGNTQEMRITQEYVVVAWGDDASSGTTPGTLTKRRGGVALGTANPMVI